MRENLVKQKLKNGEAVFGVMGVNVDPVLAEIVGLAGFDFYMMDAEHGAIDPAAAERIVRGCEAVGITPLARIRSIDDKLISQFLDTGLMAVMIPGIRSADDLRCVIDAVKYPPLGRRGLGPIRAANYMLGPMTQAEYVRFANEQTMVLAQIEHAEAVRHLDEMVRIEGVDGFVIGPRDLAMSMGYYDGPHHDEVRGVIDEVFRIVLAAGLVIGNGGDSARSAIERGVKICITSVTELIKSGAAVYLRGVRS